MKSTIFKKLLDFVLPPVCPICKEPVCEKDTLCSRCFKSIHFVTNPCCSVCGRPFSFDVLGVRVCAKCLANPPLFKKALSVAVYDEMSKKLILPFKHGDQLDLVPLLSKMMALRGRSLIQNSNIIIPVPLHRLRLLKRKYNQSAVIAHRLARMFDKDYIPDGLKRIRYTPSQGKFSPEQRKKNVTNAFRINSHISVKEKAVLLVDDVLTTGATANECAKVLLKAGAKRVDLLTFTVTTPK